MSDKKEKEKEPAEDLAEEVEAEDVKGSKRASGRQPMSVSRRSVVIGAASTAVLLGLGGLRYAGHNPIPRPPGGQDEAHLVSACIRCEKCYEACPRKVIKPAHIEDGLLGMRTPTLDFDSGYCDFCTESNGGTPKCVATCPTKALALPSDATWQNTKIGIAVIDTRQCLAYRDTGCHYCADVCPQQAILFENSQSKEKSLRPYVVEDLCNGCGACQSVCVSLTTGSIAEGAKERAIVVKCI